MRNLIFTLAGLFLAASQTVAQPPDEARRTGRTAVSMPHAGEDYFRDMDNGIALTPEEIRGRNMWIVWTGGNDRFWNGLTHTTFGAFDLLKIVTTHPGQPTATKGRWD